MSIEDAIELGQRSIYHATFRDAVSGGTVSGAPSYTSTCLAQRPAHAPVAWGVVILCYQYVLLVHFGPVKWIHPSETRLIGGILIIFCVACSC